MTKDHELARNRKVDQIITRKMLGIFGWKRPIVENSIGPYDPSAFDYYEGEIRQIENEHRAFLEKYSLDDLSLRFDASGVPKDEGFWDSTVWKKLCYQKIRISSQTPPAWFDAGFGNTLFKADFNYWAAMSSISTHEAVCLSIGFEPSKFEATLYENDSRPVVEFFHRRYELVNRRFSDSPRISNPSPEEFVEWGRNVHLDMHEEFVNAVDKIGKPNVQKRDLDVRERTSLLQIIYLMAMDGYGFSPLSKRSDIPKLLSEVADLNGIGISRDTIRNHLNASKEFHKGEWKTE